MTDRKLLELAAKAAGIEIYFDEDDDCYRVKDSGSRKYWNPILFDGDALRLAVKLEMFLDLTIAMCKNADVDANTSTEDCNNDPYAATRRAIVRAAAAIGKSMEVTK
jgi:hypothetical protein